MQPSPLQLQNLKFVNVKIDARETPKLDEIGQTFPPHQFNNTTFISTIEHAPAEDDPESPLLNFVVSLQVELPDEGENPPPYIVDVKCIGYFSLLKEAFPDPVKRYDVAVVNGTSILYGALRELVSNVTARSWCGQLLLPSANFQNDAPSNGGHQPMDEKPKPKLKAKKRNV